MSRYKTLITEAENEFISPFAVPDIIETKSKQIEYSTKTPAPKIVPSGLSPQQKSTRSISDKTWDSVYPSRAGNIYGTSSNQYASLRYYGHGPY